MTATPGASEAGSSHSGHTGWDQCPPVETDLWGQDCWLFPTLCQGSCRTSGTGKGPGLLRAASHSVSEAHRPDSAKRPWPRDSSGGRVVGPTSHISQAILAPLKKKIDSALILYVCLIFGSDNKTPKFKRVAWVVRNVYHWSGGVGQVVMERLWSRSLKELQPQRGRLVWSGLDRSGAEKKAREDFVTW